MEEAEPTQTEEEMSDELSEDSSMCDNPEELIHITEQRPAEHEPGTTNYIGPITENHRFEKVMRYLQKKYERAYSKKYSYKCRQVIAEKRLRIKGRFVNKEQAYEILQLDRAQEYSHTELQDMLTKKANEPAGAANNASGPSKPSAQDSAMCYEGQGSGKSSDPSQPIFKVEKDYSNSLGSKTNSDDSEEIKGKGLALPTPDRE